MASPHPCRPRRNRSATVRLRSRAARRRPERLPRARVRPDRARRGRPPGKASGAGPECRIRLDRQFPAIADPCNDFAERLLAGFEQGWRQRQGHPRLAFEADQKVAQHRLDVGERPLQGGLKRGQSGSDALQGGGLPRRRGGFELGAHACLGRGSGLGAGGGKRGVQFRLAENPCRRRRARRGLRLTRRLEPGEVERRRRAGARRLEPRKRGIARSNPLTRMVEPQIELEPGGHG
jgi:hypothetical protein